MRSDIAAPPILRLWRRQRFPNNFMIFLRSFSTKRTPAEISLASTVAWAAFASDMSRLTSNMLLASFCGISPASVLQSQQMARQVNLLLPWWSTELYGEVQLVCLLDRRHKPASMATGSGRNVRSSRVSSYRAADTRLDTGSSGDLGQCIGLYYVCRCCRRRHEGPEMRR